MSDAWPYGPPDDDDGLSLGLPTGKPRMIRMAVPLGIPGHPVTIQLMMTEPDARAITNTSDELADDLGAVFVLIKESLAEFLFHEG